MVREGSDSHRIQHLTGLMNANFFLNNNFLLTCLMSVLVSTCEAFFESFDSLLCPDKQLRGEKHIEHFDKVSHGMH